jgi:hypothetical protein
MSHIPNSAIPHAAPSEEAEPKKSGSGISRGAKKIADKARANPKTAAAAGAAVVAGVVAAAAVPLMRSRKTGGKSGTAKSSSGAKKKS